jgi:hypothetical protein
MGSFNQMGIVIFDKSFPIASFKIAHILKLYFSGVKAGRLSLILRVYDIGIPPYPKIYPVVPRLYGIL